MIRPIFKTSVILGCAVVYAVVAILVSLRSETHETLKLLFLQHSLLLFIFWVWPRIPDDTSAKEPKISLPPLSIALISYSLLAAILVFGFQRGLAIGDESSYAFQSRIFARGWLTAEAPPLSLIDAAKSLKEFGFHHHVIYRGMWFSKYPPGWPAILVLGQVLNIDKLLNVLLGFLILLIAYQISERLFDKEHARAAIWIMVLSPFFIFNCMGYMSHPSCGVLVIGSAFFLFRGLEELRISSFCVASLLAGLAFLIRPFTALCVAVVIGGFSVYRLRCNPKRGIIAAFCQGLIQVSFAAVYLIYNRSLTGSVWLSTYALYRNTSMPVEIATDVRTLLSNLSYLSRWSLEGTLLYAVPFCLLLVVYAVCRERDKPFEIATLTVFAFSLIVGYVVQSEPSGSHYGERYYFETFWAFAILGARGLIRLSKSTRLNSWNFSAIGLSVVLVQTIHFFLFAVAAHNELQPYALMRERIIEMQTDHTVVFMVSNPDFDARDLNQNDPDWRISRVFYMPDPGADRRPYITCSLGRKRWVVFSIDGSTVRIESKGDVQCADGLSGGSVPGEERENFTWRKAVHSHEEAPAGAETF